MYLVVRFCRLCFNNDLVLNQKIHYIVTHDNPIVNHVNMLLLLNYQAILS